MPISSELEFIPAELREISVSGGLLYGEFQPPIGTDIVLEITPPGSEVSFDLSGRVVYHAGVNQTGVRFASTARGRIAPQAPSAASRPFNHDGNPRRVP